MSFSNVVGGKLKLKGKVLDLKPGGITKKKKRRDRTQVQLQLQLLTAGLEVKGNNVLTQAESGDGEGGNEKQKARPYDDHMTPAEKRYHEQKAKLEARPLAKLATKSHRQRVEEFNQYLADLSEHYDIPRVGPG